MKFNITTGRNDFHQLYVLLRDFPKVSDPEVHSRAWQRVREAGYEIWNGDGKRITLVRFWMKQEIYGESRETDVILCDTETLVSAASSLSKEDLCELLAQAFEAHEEESRAYAQKIADAREAAGKRRGRPTLADDERRAAYVGANVPADLKAWASCQPEGISGLLYRLLEQERARRGEQK